MLTSGKEMATRAKVLEIENQERERKLVESEQRLRETSEVAKQVRCDVM